MDNNNRMQSISSSKKNTDPSTQTNNQDIAQNESMPNSSTDSSNTPSNSGNSQPINNNGNQLNYSMNRFGNSANQSITNPNLSVKDSIANNYEKTDPREKSPTFLSTANISSLPSIESVQAAISSIGASFNQDMVFAELTSQEDSRGYVRRPMNAFMVWSKQARRRIAMAYPNLLNCEISKLLGREWGRMSSVEKEPYVTLATKLRENHSLQHPDYTYKPRKRRRKGDSKQLTDFENAAMETQLYNLTKAYPNQHPLYNTNLATFYTTTAAGGQHRYVNPGYNHGAQLATNPGMVPATYLPYGGANMMKHIGNQNNPSGNYSIQIPPLNYPNPTMMNYHNSRMSGPQNTAAIIGHPPNISANKNNNNSNTGSMGGLYADNSMPTSNNNNQMNLGPSQFYPGGSSFYSQMSTTTPTMNNNSSKNNVGNEELSNYMGNFNSENLTDILSAYATQEDHNSSIGGVGSSNVGGANNVPQGQGSTMGNMGNIVGNNNLYPSSNQQNTGGRGSGIGGASGAQRQLPLGSNIYPGNPNPYYNIQQNPNIMYPYQQQDNSANNTSNEIYPQNPNPSNSGQGPSNKDI